MYFKMTLFKFICFTLLTKKGICTAWKTDFWSKARRTECHIPIDSVRRDRKMSVCVCVCNEIWRSLFSTTTGQNRLRQPPNERVHCPIRRYWKWMESVNRFRKYSRKSAKWRIIRRLSCFVCSPSVSSSFSLVFPARARSLFHETVYQVGVMLFSWCWLHTFRRYPYVTFRTCVVGSINLGCI